MTEKVATLEAMQDRLDFAKQLQVLTNRIHATDNVAQIMLDLSADICELFQCERLTLYVHQKEQGRLVSKVKHGMDTDKDLILPVSKQSIAGYVALKRTTVRIHNLANPAELKAIDPEMSFFDEVDRVTGFSSRQMLAAPLLLNPARELVGVLQLINQRSGGRFDRAAEEGLEVLTSTLAQAFAQRMKMAALLPKRYEALAAQGVIAAAELELATRWAQRKDKDLEQVLAEDFHIPLAAIGKAVAKQANMDYQPLDPRWRPNPEIARKLTRSACQQHQCCRCRSTRTCWWRSPPNRTTGSPTKTSIARFPTTRYAFA